MLPEFRYFSKNFRGKMDNIAKSLFINAKNTEGSQIKYLQRYLDETNSQALIKRLLIFLVLID